MNEIITNKEIFCPLKVVFLVLIILNIFHTDLYAIDKFNIESDVDTSYLPYYIELSDLNDWGAKSKIIYNPIHVYKPAISSTQSGCYIRVSNPSLNYPRPATFSMVDARESIRLIDDDSIDLIVNDWSFYNDSNLGFGIITGGGTRNDSAFVFKINPEIEEPPELLFLQSESDHNGDGFWDASLIVLLIDDYDYDGIHEIFIYIDPKDEMFTRTLYCIELEKFKIEWKIPVALILDHGRLFSLEDSLNPGIIIHGYNPKNDINDDNFNDQYSYIAMINAKGEIIYSKIVAFEHFSCSLIPSEQKGVFYLPHQVELETISDTLEYTDNKYYLSKITKQGEVLKTISLSMKPNKIWLMPYRDARNKALFVQNNAFTVFIFNSELEPIAEAQAPRVITYFGTIRLPSSDEDALFFRDGIYDFSLKKLLHLSQGCANYYEPLIYDRHNSVTDIVLGGGNCWCIGSIKKKPLSKILSIVFVNNKDYFLVIMTGTIVALYFVNFYRRKTKSNLILIKKQKNELEKMHQELKDAQQKIIEQEKYKQAKDIAGGFAHEIRNALYPVDIIIAKLKMSDDIGKIEENKLREYLKSIDISIGKAVDLTELISQYTKLDSQYIPERVNLDAVIKEVINSNRSLIDNSGISLEYDNTQEYVVISNHKQLAIVLNNLLLNCIDALSNNSEPAINIGIGSDYDFIELHFRDNGIGIESDKIDRIFEAFYSTKPDKGKGIGLSLSKKIVEMYGGIIMVESGKDKGTTFVIRLKRHSDEG
nr:HAMP domain-containing histidine kinase [candidate division Zixibacteria bacterium]